MNVIDLEPEQGFIVNTPDYNIHFFDMTMSGFYFNAFLVLVSFLVLIPRSGSATYFNGGVCERDCDFHRKRLHGDRYRYSFTFSCNDFSRGDRKTCRRTCAGCPKSVCDPENDPSQYRCPSTDFSWPRPPPGPYPEPPDDEESYGLDIIYWILIGVGVLVVIAIAVVACICIAKNRRGRAGALGTMPLQQPGSYQYGGQSIAGEYSRQGMMMPPQQQQAQYQYGPMTGSVPPASGMGYADSTQPSAPPAYGQWSYPVSGDPSPVTAQPQSIPTPSAPT